jgi:DNA (cytosine-5)-methyltransferase 1
MGYARAGFEVVGVDIEPQPKYPFEFHRADALTFPLAGFDVIHASPPCQGYSNTRFIQHKRKPVYDLLLGPTRERLMASGVPWVLENVPQAPMLHGLELCGTTLGVGVRRHRLFDSSHFLFAAGRCRHRTGDLGVYAGKVTLLGSHATAYIAGSGRTHYRPKTLTLRDGQAAMGIDWMRMDEMCEAIPPAYSEWIGRQLMSVLGAIAA